MLEIIALMFLTRWYGNLADRKGVNPSPYKWLTIALWFAGELLGLTVALKILDISITSFTLTAYILSILGALIGALLAFFIVTSANIFNRWFRFATGLVALLLFGFQIALWRRDSGLTVDLIGAFTMITFGLFFVAFGASYRSLKLSGRALFFSLVAGAWILGGVALIVNRITNPGHELSICAPVLLFSVAGSIIGIVWTLIDSARNTNV